MSAIHRWLSRYPTLARVAPFILVFVAATWLHFALRTQIATAITRDVNAALAAAIINVLTPEAGVSVRGEAELGSGAHWVSIATGCDGIDAMLMLLAAVAVFPAPIRRKVVGLLLGGSILFTVNVLRIAAIWYCLRYWPTFFDTMHLTVGQTVVIAVAVGFFAVWTGLLSSGAAPSTPAPTERST